MVVAYAGMQYFTVIISSLGIVWTYISELLYLLKVVFKFEFVIIFAELVAGRISFTAQNAVMPHPFSLICILGSTM